MCPRSYHVQKNDEVKTAAECKLVISLLLKVRRPLSIMIPRNSNPGWVQLYAVLETTVSKEGRVCKRLPPVALHRWHQLSDTWMTAEGKLAHTEFWAKYYNNLALYLRNGSLSLTSRSPLPSVRFKFSLIHYKSRWTSMPDQSWPKAFAIHSVIHQPYVAKILCTVEMWPVLKSRFFFLAKYWYFGSMWDRNKDRCSRSF